MDNMQLTSLPDGIFDENPLLNRVWLSNNRITSILAGVFTSNLTSLQQLFVSVLF